MLDVGHHVLALQARHLGRGDLAGQVRVLAVGLVGPAPARVAHQVGCRAERDVHALAGELGALRRALLLDQGRVPGRGGVLAVGEGGHAAGAVTDTVRAVLQVHRLDAQVRDAGDLADVGRGAVAGDQGHLFGLVHGVEHLLDPLGDRRGGADPGADPVAAVAVAAGHRRGGGQPVDVELEDRVAELGAAGGGVDADVAVGRGRGERRGPAGAGRRGVDVGPGRVVVGHLDLERRGVRGLPEDAHAADLLLGAEVDVQPLRVAGRAGPAGARVAVGGVGRRVVGGVLGRGGRGRLVQREVLRAAVLGRAGAATAAASATAAEPWRRPGSGGSSRWRPGRRSASAAPAGRVTLAVTVVQVW